MWFRVFGFPYARVLEPKFLVLRLEIRNIFPVAKGDKVLITGAAGFIGFHLSDLLCKKGYLVTGIDNINDYYDVQLKQDRISVLSKHPSFEFHRIDMANKPAMEKLF